VQFYMPDGNAKYYISLLIAMFFWGGSWVSAKIIVSIAPPFTIGFFRFFIASVLFLGLIAATSSVKQVFSRKNLRNLFLLGLTGIFGYGVLFLVGMGYTTAAQGSIIAGFNPVTISLFAHAIHHEKLLRRWQYLGFAVSFIGVIFVVGVQAMLDFQINYFIGNLIILAAMCTWGLYTSIGKEAMKTISSAEMNLGGTVFGAMLFGVFALTESPWSLPALQDPIFWFNILFLSVLVTFVAFFFYFTSIKALGATRTGGFINFVPVFGTLLSVLILSEPIYWTFLVGLILVITGVSIINFPIRGQGHKVERTDP
jgi:drug/metabolite transporter (DMT)-like permease